MNDTVKGYKRWDVPHPMPYQGSKRGLAPLILSYFPAHVSRLVEPFAGFSRNLAGGGALAASAERFLINDAHSPVIELWREIIDHPEALARKYRCALAGAAWTRTGVLRLNPQEIQRNSQA